MCVGGLGDRRRAANRRKVRLRCLADRLFIAVRDLAPVSPFGRNRRCIFPQTRRLHARQLDGSVIVQRRPSA